ncbi:MAG: iron-sulfur cluster repair di-iron protein [Bryobacteraceae bacterium]
MATDLETKTIGEIAAELPGSIRVFERYGIDYCCGGKVSVADACARGGIAPETLLRELITSGSAPSGADFDAGSTTLSELIDHIVARHHGYLKSELPRLSGLLEKVTRAHGAKHGDTLIPLARIFGALRSELESHLMKEEMVLFPIIRRLEEANEAGRNAGPFHCGSVQNPIRVMEHEHDSAGNALEEMRGLTANYMLPADGCNTYRALFTGLQELEADLHQHIHLENNILFPRAAQLETVAAGA